MASTCSPSPLHPSMTMRSAKSAYSGYSTNRNAGSRAALITECSSSNSSSGGKRTLVRTSSNCSEDDNYATLYDYMEEKSINGLETSQAILAAQVDASGARLQLRKSGAYLLLPENALDTSRMVYLAVSDQIGDRPKLQPSESALSSVVVAGECESECDSDSRILLKPVIISFRHCASIFPRDNWIFSLYADEGFGWQRVLTVGEENLNTTMHVHMEPPGKSDGFGWCHVMTETFANFIRVMLAGRPRRTSISACKRVHLAAYGPAFRPEKNFELRVYCVPETGSAMESVAKQEEHGRLDIINSLYIDVLFLYTLTKVFSFSAERHLMQVRFENSIYFATRPGCSPTALLLDLWEAAECGSARATHDLLQTLRVMGRPDAVLLLEQFLAHFSYLTSP
uniref:Death domain-containing protein n=1 Tax=Heterorhabditis bacteriophora TaxID=37862 RepID=A0A1I7X7F2_HETBA